VHALLLLLLLLLLLVLGVDHRQELLQDVEHKREVEPELLQEVEHDLLVHRLLLKMKMKIGVTLVILVLVVVTTLLPLVSVNPRANPRLRGRYVLDRDHHLYSSE